MFTRFFNSTEEKRIVAAIEAAEKNTSGEIRVHVEKKCVKDPIERAVEVFSELKMQQTKERNGVLFYVATDTHKFAVIGDKGINDLVGNDFWVSTKDKMQAEFRNGNFCDGIVHGIEEASVQLKKHFPYEKHDKDELTNEISFGK